MERVFKLAYGWRIFTCIISPAMIGLAVWLLWVGAQGPDYRMLWLWIPIAVGMISLFVYALLDVWKSAVILTDEYILQRDIFYERKIFLDQVKGIRLNEHYLIFESQDGNKVIKVSRYYAGFQSLLQWASESYADLDYVAKLKSELEILSNDEFGITPEQREQQLVHARRICKYLNNSVWLLVIWILFFPKPYELVFTVAGVFPLLLIAVGYWYRGIIQLDDDDQSAYPSVTLALSLTSSSLLLRIIFDFNLLDYSVLWSTIIPLALLLTYTYVLPMKLKVNSIKRVFLLTVVALLMLSYSFGIYVSINCLLDPSNGKVFTTTLAGKRVSKQRTILSLIPGTAGVSFP